MAAPNTNMLDYLTWRGDLPLSLDPWNAIDALILSMLSYLTFAPERQGLVETDAVLPFPEKDDFMEGTRSLLHAAALTRRFAELTMHDGVSVLDNEKQIQFGAVTADLPDGGHFVSFRGTDNSLVGWREDLTMAFESPIPAQGAALAYLERIAAASDGPLLLGGHSKGGNLAVYAAAHAAPETQARIRRVYSFDGPGVDDATFASDGYQAIARRISAFVPRSSIVGLLLSYHPEHTVVRSSGISVWQHDPFTWQVRGPSFVRVEELDVASQLIDQTVHAWLAKSSPEQRRVFVTTLFDLLEATGASTFRELAKDLPGSAAAIWRAGQNVDTETRKMMLKIIGQFISTSALNLRGFILSRETERLPERTAEEENHE